MVLNFVSTSEWTKIHQSFRCLALAVWDKSVSNMIKEGDEVITDKLISINVVCRTALATPGLLTKVVLTKH